MSEESQRPNAHRGGSGRTWNSVTSHGRGSPRDYRDGVIKYQCRINRRAIKRTLNIVRPLTTLSTPPDEEQRNKELVSEELR